MSNHDVELAPLKVQKCKLPSLTGEGMNTIDAAIKAGHLKTFLVGRRRFAMVADVHDWLNFLKSESDAGRPVVYRSRALEEGGAE